MAGWSTGVKGIKGRAFTYQDIKKVYVIVLFEKSPGIFHKNHYAYLHHGRTQFDTGLDMELLQEYYLIALDVFRNFPYPKDKNEQTAWLSLLVTEDLKEAETLINRYPWLTVASKAGGGAGDVFRGIKDSGSEHREIYE